MQPAHSFSETIFPHFFAIWGILGIAGFLFFRLGNKVELKRRWLPRYIVIVGTLFMGFLSLQTIIDPTNSPPVVVLIFIFPIIALMCYLGMKMTKFCGSCGGVILPYNGLLIPTKFCPKCGTKTDNIS